MTTAERIRQLEQREQSYKSDAAFCSDHAKACRDAKCLRSAEKWQKQAEYAEGMAQLARTEREGLS